LTIQRHQLKDAYQDPRVGERSFVLAIDEESQKARIAHVRDLLDEFPRGIAAHGVSSLDWSPISRWLARWFACREAPSSDLRAQGNVEGLLENFVREEDAPDRVWVFDREPDDLYDFPEGYRPAQAWTHVALQEEGQNSEEIFDPPEKR
jgi:hypothetical protein